MTKRTGIAYAPDSGVVVEYEERRPVVRRHTRDLAWRALNPLRAWRVATGTRAVTLAHRLGVNKMSVMYWERGDRTPKRPTMRRLAAETGIPDIDRRWLRWLADRPDSDAAGYTNDGGEA